MCGLCGVAGPGIMYRDIDVLDQLAYCSGIRGLDGAGIVQGKSETFGKKKNNYIVSKSAQDISYFKWYHAKAKGGNHDLFKGVGNNFFAVHTRGASRGIISDDNAHPFSFSNLIGMHNGTLLDEKYHDAKKTDSELLFKDINQRGLVPVLEELHPKSAYALVIYDKKKGELVFTRNAERPLYLAFAKHRTVMYWASEEWYLRGVLERNDVDILNDEISLIDTHTVFTVHPGAIPRGTNEVFETREYKAPTFEDFYKKNPRTRLQSQQDLLEPYWNWPRRGGSNNWDPSKMHGHESSEDKVAYERQRDFECAELKEGEKIPYTNCANCDKKMGLTEQFFGKRLEDKTFVCEECVIATPFEITAAGLKSDTSKALTVLKETIKDNDNNNEVRVG